MSRITDAGLAAFKTGRLENLDLSAAAGLTDAGLVPFVRAHPGLSRLQIGAATDVGDATLDELAKRQRLWWLEMDAAKNVTHEGLDRFSKAQPNGAFRREPPAILR